MQNSVDMWMGGWRVDGCVDTWIGSKSWCINPSINTRKIAKLCVDVCGYRYGCVNVNVADFISANGNVAGCVNVYEKILCVY